MQQFIGRKIWLRRFQDYLQQDDGIIWRITGQPGIGKSTLLRRFENDCAEAEHPVTGLDMEGFAPAHGLEVLTEMVRSARFFHAETAGKTKREKAGEAAVWLKDKLGGAMDVGKLLDPTGGLIVGGAKVLLDLGMGLAGGAAQMSETAAAAHPEQFLLEALAKAGEKHPVCLIDTYEHILRPDLKINSRLSLGYGQAREGQEKAMPLAAWLADVFDYLQGKGWRIVMIGRSIPRSKADDNLPRFSRAEIREAAANRPNLRDYLPTQEAAIVGVLATLSFDGNPLWLQVAMNLLENLLAEGKDLEQLAQQPDYLQTCFEEEDPFDLGAYDGIEHGRCKLALFNTLTRHIAGLEDQAWKIALPRVLDKGIVAQLFAAEQARAILHNFKIAGVFRDSGQQFTLHEEIRDLLLAYARSKGWLDTDETRALHGKLWDYLNHFYLGKLPPELHSQINREGLKAIFGEKDRKAAETRITQQLSEHFPLNWMLEACYHRVFSLAELPGNAFTPAQFWQGVGGSASLSPLNKWYLMESLPDLSAFQVAELASIFSNELGKWREMFGEETAQALWQAQLAGHPAVLTDIDFWERRISEHGLPGDHYGCASALITKGWTLGEKLDDPAGEVAVYDALLQRYGDSSVPGVQELCANALVNKSRTLMSLNDWAGMLACCDEVLTLHRESDNPELQVACATALSNKTAALLNFGDVDNAIIYCDEVLSRHKDSDKPELQVACANTWINKSSALMKTANWSEVIACCDEVINRYGTSDKPEMQTAYAGALVNKGVAIGVGFNDPASEVAVYDALLQRYGDSRVSGVQEGCAKALFYKGMTLGRLDDLAGAVACFDDVLVRYSQSENPAIQGQCHSVEENTAELLLVLGRNAEAIPRIRQVLERVGVGNQKYAIMTFLLWLAEADTTPQAVLATIRALSPEVEFAWSWDDIRPLVDKLPEPRKTQAECFVAFFEQHHDMVTLENCLAVMSG